MNRYEKTKIFGLIISLSFLMVASESSELEISSLEVLETQLRKAILGHRSLGLECLIERILKISNSDTLEKHLKIAILNYNYTAAISLLRAGAPGHAVLNDKGETILHHAVATYRCPDEVFGLLLKNGAQINAQDSTGRTALHAVFSLKINYNEYGLDSGRLHSQAVSKRIQWLLDQKAQVDLDSTDEPLVFLAIGYESLAEKFIAAGADLNKPEGSFGDTPLHQAAFLYKSNLVALLIKHGANVHAKNKHGETPLHKVVQPYTLRNNFNKAEEECVRLLLVAGASINEPNSLKSMRMRGDSDPNSPREFCDELVLFRGYTPFMGAAYKKKEASISNQNCVWLAASMVGKDSLALMLDHECTKDTQDGLLLHQCATVGTVAQFCEVYQRGISLTDMDKLGRTPFHYFARNNQRGALSELIAYANNGRQTDFIQDLIRQTYALFLPHLDEVRRARIRLFNYLCIFQGKFKLPPYIVLEILLFDTTYHEDLAVLLTHELETGNPASSIILSNGKEILVKQLVKKAQPFFVTAFEKKEIKPRNQFYGFRWKKVETTSGEACAYNAVWVASHLERLLLEGIKHRFKQLSDRVKNVVKKEKDNAHLIE